MDGWVCEEEMFYLVNDGGNATGYIVTGETEHVKRMTDGLTRRWRKGTDYCPGSWTWESP